MLPDGSLMRQSHDKSHNDYKNEEFRVPFVVSCIFDNPLHEESVACLKGIEKRIKEKAGAASEEYLINSKNQGEKRFVLQDYYGRKYLNAADSLRTEIQRDWRIDPAVYQQLPDVDDRYIDAYLNELKADHTEKLPDNCYIRTYGSDNTVVVRNPSDFMKDCERLLSWQKHLHYVDSRDADREFIQHEEQRWSDFRSAVLRQRLAG